MTEIRFLPDHLTVVPSAPRAPDDPDADACRAEYRAWRDNMYRFRVERQAILRAHPELIPLETYYCAQDFGYWLSVYGTIFEPREDRNALGGGNLPFIPFAKQIDMANFFFWVLTQKGANGDGVVSKTRDVGASWMICAIALHGWLYKNPWNVLLVSRKEELVDSKNHRALFAKIDRMYWGLPDWMRPKGYDPDKHRQKLFMLNPENHNELAGESTTGKTGRADRATWGAFDEAALIPQLFNTWNGVAATMGHRFAVSTEHLDEGMDFWNLRTGEGMDYKPALFELDWWDNPLNDQAYFDNEKIRYASRPADFEREILRNPHAGQNTFAYGEFQDPKYTPDEKYNAIDPMAPTYITIDPGKLDETAIVVIQQNMSTLEWVILDSYQNKGKDADFYGTLLAGAPDDEKFAGLYSYREHEFMDLIRDIPAPTYTGDTYGDSSNGATLETFYSVIGKYTNPQGAKININRDRFGQKDRGMYARSRNTFKGRQQCLHEVAHHLCFSARPGGQFAYKCLKNHRFKPDDGRGLLSEPSATIHDWTSHITQAIEFWGVYLKTRSDLLNPKKRPEDKKVAAPRKVAHLASIRGKTARSTLYTRK